MVMLAAMKFRCKHDSRISGFAESVFLSRDVALKKYVRSRIARTRRTLYRLRAAVQSYLRTVWQGKRSDRKVDFIVAGVQKGGTTALDAYLRVHEQISMPFRKELHYFDNAFFFLLPRPTYRSYHAAFDGDGVKIRGKCCPSYIYEPAALTRIYNYNPHVKIIVVLRDPVDRAYSQWNMEKQRGREKRSFINAVRDEVDDLAAGRMPFFGYVPRGFYTKQIRKLTGIFQGVECARIAQ